MRSISEPKRSTKKRELMSNEVKEGAIEVKEGTSEAKEGTRR